MVAHKIYCTRSIAQDLLLHVWAAPRGGRARLPAARPARPRRRALRLALALASGGAGLASGLKAVALAAARLPRAAFLRLSSARWVGLRPPARSPAGARSRRRGPCSASPRLGALRRAGARLACRLRLSLVCARAPSRLLWALPGPRWALVPAPAGPPCLAASACPWVAGRSSAARGLSARWRGPRGVAFRAPARWGLSGAGWCRRSAPVRSRPRQAGAMRPALTAGAVVGYE